MKDYTIWLKGGQVIYGTCEDGTARRISNMPKRIMKFTDSDGDVVIRRDAIHAIAVSENKGNTQAHKDTSNVIVEGFK